MSTLGKLYRGETHIDFVGNRNRGFAVSAAALVIALGSMIFSGFNFSVDFEGGTVIEVENPNAVTITQVRDVLRGVGVDGAKVQLVGGGSGIRVQAAQLAVAQEDAAVEALSTLAGVDAADASRETVSPTFGSQVAESAIRALITFLIVVAIYMSIRLEWKMALAGMLALAHDLILTAGVYSLSGFEVSPSTVIAILTILGYSLYDTVVVFDKVLENVQERGERHSISTIVNMSMNQVFMRSLNTSLSTLLPIGSLLFVGSFLLGATTLREFALALFIGVFMGTYSSIFIASPVLARWKEQEERWQRIRRRVDRKGSDDEFAMTHGPGSGPQVVAPMSSGAAPRPPRKRRKKR